MVLDEKRRVPSWREQEVSRGIQRMQIVLMLEGVVKMSCSQQKGGELKAWVYSWSLSWLWA